jgi:hypothetical protein
VRKERHAACLKRKPARAITSNATLFFYIWGGYAIIFPYKSNQQLKKDAVAPESIAQCK